MASVLQVRPREELPIEMQNSAAAMRKFFDGQGWRWRRAYQLKAKATGAAGASKATGAADASAADATESSPTAGWSIATPGIQEGGSMATPCIQEGGSPPRDEAPRNNAKSKSARIRKRPASSKFRTRNGLCQKKLWSSLNYVGMCDVYRRRLQLVEQCSL